MDTAVAWLGRIALLTPVLCLPWLNGCERRAPDATGPASEGPAARGAPPRRIVEDGWKATWSPDGTQLAYGVGEGQGIEIVELATLQRRQVVPRGKDPAWSPDGRLIAYIREPSHNQYTEEEIWVVEPGGANPRRVGPGGYPSWSADGGEIYAHSRRSNAVVAYQVDRGGGEPRVVFADALSWYPAVSPDARRIAFGSAGRLDIVDRETRKVVMSWPTPQDRGLLPAWSPDGRYLAFGGFDGSPLGLCVLEVEQARAAIVVPGPHTMPAWSPDGGRLAFDRRDAGRQVWMVGRDLVEAKLADPAAALPREVQPERILPPPGLRPPVEDTSTLRGQPAPDFTLSLLDGGTVQLVKLKGNVVVLDFWATWCPPCRRSLPNLQKVAADIALREKGLRVYAVDGRETEEVVRRYLTQNRLTFPVPMDTKGEVAALYRVQGIPTTVVIDRKGVIRDVMVGFGPQSEQLLSAAIERALAAE